MPTHRTNNTRILVFIILDLTLTFYLAPTALPFVLPVRGSSRTISLVGSFPVWNSSNPTITVTQGDTITMQLSSGDGIPHRFLVDVDSDGSDVSDCPTTDPCSAQFSTSTTYTFTVNFAPGRYKYICTIHYPNMVGDFIVQAPTVPDFTITLGATPLTLPPGSTSTATITLTSVNSFVGTVNLTSAVNPGGPQLSLSRTSVPLSSNSATATLTISTTSGTYSTPVPQGNYNVTVTGTSVSSTHSASISVTVSSAPSSTPSIPLTLIIEAAIAGIALVAIVAVAIYTVRRRPKP